MFRFPAVVLLLASASTFVFSQSQQRSPSDITKSFIADYKIWNDQAHSLYEREKEKADKAVEDTYQQLIIKYCQTGKKHQPLAFGSESIHHPEHEKIISEKIKGNKAIVKTEYKKSEPVKITDHYEYHFIKINKQWYLEEVYYVDEDGKYKGL
ncbi:MAG: hypothetical protein ACK5RG_20510 [Cyclobacteriaceae bacterium]|jgi:hypothetical protein|nr:hypothetical protein [Flammeovirgaceae bacterium]